MDHNSIRDLIEKAKEIVGEKEYEEIRAKYKFPEQKRYYLGKRHALLTGRAKRLFETAIARKADEIDLKFIAVYFLMCIDAVKHNLDVARYENENNIIGLRWTYEYKGGAEA